MEPKYPNINIPLVGEDGNAFSILARVQTAMKRNGLRDEISAFHAQATSGDYDNLLRTVMEWFAVDEHLTDEDEDECSECGYSDCDGTCWMDEEETDDEEEYV